jgi:hypothetical protein
LFCFPRPFSSSSSTARGAIGLAELPLSPRMPYRCRHRRGDHVVECVEGAGDNDLAMEWNEMVTDVWGRKADKARWVSDTGALG